jgi:hypothetical protein
MAHDRTPADFQTPKELAGEHYDEMLRSKDDALRYLFYPDYNVRIAALAVCESQWNCGSDQRFIDACREIAISSAEGSIRLCAIRALATARRSSRSSTLLTLLATVVRDEESPMEVRTAAYWAMREIHFGSADPMWSQQMFHDIKRVLQVYPHGLDEEQIKRALLGRGPDSDWEEAEAIDWEFVNQFTTRDDEGSS